MSKSSSSKAIIGLLNDVLCSELTAINQYFLHAELCSHWGYKRLYSLVRKQSIGEMKHAEELMERILFLDGIPNLQKLGKINVGETVKEQFQLDKALEEEAIVRLNAGIEACREHQDNGTRLLLESILQSEEEHLDWIDTQLNLLNSIGEENYLAQQMDIDSK